MTRWDSMPNEILKQITTHVGTSANESEWMFVNKQSLLLYHSIVLKEIELGLDLSDKLFDSLTNSISHMGQWVKSIKFTRFAAPREIDAFQQDPLQLLMKHCPYVERVEFPPLKYIDTTAWTYFNLALSSQNEYRWSLKYLPENFNRAAHSDRYFKSAYSMRHSLEELFLTKEMMNKNNLHYLQEFQKVVTLRIESYILDSLDDYLSILPYLPYLTELDMDIYLVFPATQIVRSYPNIKKLTLRNFTPVHDQELHVIMKTFTGLKTFFLPPTNESDFWFPSTNAMLSLFQYMYTIPEFEVYNARNSSGEGELLSSYCKAQPILDTNQHHLSIGFLETCTLYLYGALFAVEITKIKSKCKLEIIYGMWNDATAERSRSVHTLSHIGGRIDSVSIDLSHRKEYQVQDYIDTIVSTASNHVRRVTISGGLFDNYPKLPNINRSHAISHLEFNETTIKESVLPFLSASFPTLKKLNFQACRFRNIQVNKTVIDMPKTEVDLLLFTGVFIDFIHFEECAVILVSVQSLIQNKHKFYMVFVEDRSHIELNLSQFEALKTSGLSGGMSVLNLCFKSIKDVMLNIYRKEPYSLHLSISS